MRRLFIGFLALAVSCALAQSAGVQSPARIGSHFYKYAGGNGATWSPVSDSDCVSRHEMGIVVDSMIGVAYDTTARAMADSCVRRNKAVTTWARGQQGTDLTFTSIAFAVRETLNNLVAMGGSVSLGSIGAASDTFMVYAVYYYTGDTCTATGGTNSAQISIAAGTTPTAVGTPSGTEVVLIAAHALNVLGSGGVSQISTYANFGTDLYGANKVTPKIYAGATPAAFNYGGSPNAEGRLTVKIKGVKVFARWAGLGAMPE